MQFLSSQSKCRRKTESPRTLLKNENENKNISNIIKALRSEGKNSTEEKGEELKLLVETKRKTNQALKQVVLLELLKTQNMLKAQEITESEQKTVQMLAEARKRKQIEHELQREEQKNTYLRVLKDLQDQKKASELSQQTYEQTMEGYRAQIKSEEAKNQLMKEKVAMVQQKEQEVVLRNEKCKVEITTLDNEIKSIQKKIAFEEKRAERFEQRLYQLYPSYERYLHATKSDLKGNIRVFCRVRPLIQVELQRETSQNRKSEAKTSKNKKMKSPKKGGTVAKGFNLPVARKKDCIEMINNTTLHITNQDQKMSFSFDVAFGKESHQEDVFYEVQDFVRSALDGFKVNIFAYGQTGSGKTYTMQGEFESSGEKRGIIPRSLEQIFHSMAEMQENNKNLAFKIEMSCIENYMEDVVDLIYPQNYCKQGKLNLSAWEPNFFEIKSPQEALGYLDKANENRRTASTKLNSTSSRSHLIAQIRIEIIMKGEVEQIGVLNLIDLAGSENTKNAQVQGDRMKEANAINKSLSTLKQVIGELLQKKQHISYRNSVLTTLLQSYLKDDSKTLMIVNVSPAAINTNESISALKFAEIVNKVKLNK